MQQLQSDSSHGFTLIEIIGVLAIMSILAATIAPSAIQMITNSKQTSEDKALAAIADALRLYVQTNKQVPAEAAANPVAAVTTTANVVAWDKAIGTIMNVPASKVSQNSINKKRIYLYPADFIAASAPNPLPYDQQAELTNLNTGNGMLVTTQPDPRVMVISNMNPSVTLATASGQLAKADFDAIWNQTNIPTAYAELTEGDKLKIARINMTDLFNAVTLSNSFSTDTYQAAIQVDGLPTTPYTWSRSSTTRNPITPYLISGSNLKLLYTDVNPVSYTNPVTPLSSFTTYDSSIVQSSSQHTFYLAGASSPATWGSTQPSNSSANNSGSGGNNNNGNNNGGGGTTGPNGGTTTISTLTGTNITNPTPMATQQSGCTSTGTYTLTLTNNSNQDYLIFEGQSSGSNFVPSNPNKVKKGKTATPQINGCSVVLLSTDQKTAPLYLFYMPNNPISYTFP